MASAPRKTCTQMQEESDLPIRRGSLHVALHHEYRLVDTERPACVADDEHEALEEFLAVAAAENKIDRRRPAPDLPPAGLPSTHPERRLAFRAASSPRGTVCCPSVFIVRRISRASTSRHA